jgi:DNA-3-methyladenine glycosylase
MSLSPLPETFYQQSVQAVARGLLGTRLVRCLEGEPGTAPPRLTGIIVETEAYQGESDLACHARAGRTARTEVMYGPAGRAYVYFIYGMHWMLNCVTGNEGEPEAVLIRAVLPAEGFEQNGGQQNARHRWQQTNGPAKVCRAFHIDGSFNGASLTTPRDSLRIEAGQPIPAEHVLIGPRVGINRVPEPWRSKPWRFRVNLHTWELTRAANLA